MRLTNLDLRRLIKFKGHAESSSIENRISDQFIMYSVIRSVENVKPINSRICANKKHLKCKTGSIQVLGNIKNVQHELNHGFQVFIFFLYYFRHSHM